MPPKSKICAGCRNEIKNKDFLDCPLCSKIYDLSCINVTEKRFRTMTLEQKQKWSCPECLSNKPKSNDSNTPVRGLMSTNAAAKSCDSVKIQCSDDVTTNITLRAQRRTKEIDSPNKSLEIIADCEPTINKQLSELIRNEIRQAFQHEIKPLIKQLFETELAPIRAQLSSIEASATFMSDQFDDLSQKTIMISQENKKLQIECDSLRQTVNDLRVRLNDTEQHMRNANIEIQGVPEYKSENVLNIVKQIAQVVSNQLEDGDILSCTRVATLNKQANRPRAIVAKLKSTRCRDELYSSVTRYNKSHPQDKLNSSLLGIAGAQVPIYVCEHLSPVNKALHAAARFRARELGFKYVWVRNGHIFMRKDDTSRFIHVKNEQHLSSIS